MFSFLVVYYYFYDRIGGEWGAESITFNRFEIFHSIRLGEKKIISIIVLFHVISCSLFSSAIVASVLYTIYIDISMKVITNLRFN